MDEDFKQAAWHAARVQAKGPAELEGFEVRDGVTFPGVEVFWGNRATRVDPQRIEYVKKTADLQRFADTIVRNLRSKPVIPTPAQIYRVQDLVREQAFFLRDILWDVLGGKAAEEAWRLAENAVRERAGKGLVDAGLFRGIRDELRRVVVAAGKKEMANARGKRRAD